MSTTENGRRSAEMKTPIILVMHFWIPRQGGKNELGLHSSFFFHSNGDTNPWMLPFQMPVLGMCISGKNTIRHSLRSIRIIFVNRSIKNPPRTHLGYTNTQWHGELNCMNSICLFQQLPHQHSTSKLFQPGLRQIDLHALKTDCYLFIYFTEHSLHDCELDTSITSNGVSFQNLLPAFVVLISREKVSQRRWRRLATEDAGVDDLPD